MALHRFLWVLAIAFGVAAGSAAAQPSGVEITPATVQVDLDSRSLSRRLLVVNHESTPQRIAVTVTDLGHDLDGAPQFLPGAFPAAAGIAIAPTSFDLAPGARQELDLRATVPRDPPSLYVAVIAEFRPPTPPAGGNVTIRTQVASLFLVRGPRPWNEAVEVAEVGIRPGPAGQPVTVYAVLRNTGNVHVRPRASVRIRKDGQEIARVQLTEANVLPGFARRLTGTWTPPPGLAGVADLEAVVEQPNATGRGSARFDDGVVAAPAAEITNLIARAGTPSHVALALRNTGTEAIAPAIGIRVTSLEGVEHGAFDVTAPLLSPGASHETEWRPALPDGTYLIRAQATVGDALLDEATTGLRVGRAADEPLPPIDEEDEGGLGAAGVIAVLLLLGVGALLFVLFRRRRRDEPEDSDSQ